MIASLCDSSAILHVIYYVKVALDVIGICAPILLILFLSLELLNAVKSQDNDALANVKKKSIPMFFATIIIFLIPGLVRIVASVSSDELEFVGCINKANKETISQLKAEEEAEKKIQEEEQRKKWEEKLKEQKELEEALKKENDPEEGDSSQYIDGGTITGSDITYIDITDLGCPIYYSNHVTILEKLGFNSQIADQVHGILKNVCSYKNKTPWLSQLETAGSYVNKPGYHGRGLAIDINNLWSYTKNGKTYSPYALYGGTSANAWPNYEKFICEVCNGNEDCPYNVNYQIYEKYFKNNGWCWGGNWGPSYFDPMHFELSDSGCSTSNKNRINCG